MQWHPLIGILTYLREVWREHNGLGAVVARFGEEVGIRCARHIQTGTHVCDHL